MTKRDDWTRERADMLWKEAGRPDGGKSKYQEQANAEWEAGARNTQAVMGCAKLVHETGAATAKLTPG
jgi:hypothetical protein